jgi:hypothetical protein
MAMVETPVDVLFPVIVTAPVVVSVPVQDETHVIKAEPVAVGAGIEIEAAFKFALPFIKILSFTAEAPTAKVIAPITVVVDPVAKEKEIAAAGAVAKVNAPIVRVPLVDLSFDNTRFVGTVIVPPQVIAPVPAKDNAPVPVMVIAPVPVLNVVPFAV